MDDSETNNNIVEDRDWLILQLNISIEYEIYTYNRILHIVEDI